MPSISRRGFLIATALSPAIVRAAKAPAFEAFPFSLGVASGYPLPDGVVIWTRLAPKPLEGGGMDPEPVEVAWEVAEDESFRRIVKKGVALADPVNAHAVHVEVTGLAPARRYHYRFHCGAATSPSGRTRTAPAPGQGDARLRLAVASCQQYEQGYFVAHRHLAAEEVDLVAFVGDYIYESSWGRDRVRAHGTAEPGTLDEYRNRHALYKSDADLQASHAAHPWVVTWDDHEVDNDYAGERSEELDPGFARRRAAAYKAFLEHQPVRPSMWPVMGHGVTLHTRVDWGMLARLHILDARQFKTPQACPKPYRGGGNVVGAACTERLEEGRSMLGMAQERWLDEGLAKSRAGWNLLVQQTLFAPAGRPGKEGLVHWTDGWDGYPAARARLLRSLVERRPANPVILGGDIHAAVAADIHAEPDNPASPVVAAEFIGSSITSQGPGWKPEALLAANPHIRYANTAVRGYGVVTLDRDRLEARLRGVATVKQPQATIDTVATARVEAGRPGLQR